MNKCPICGADTLGNREYKGKKTDKARFATYRCKRCGCCWHVAVYPGRSMDRVDAVIRDYLSEYKKIAAIKALRSVTELGLKEAKDYVDKIETNMIASGDLNKRPVFRYRRY